MLGCVNGAPVIDSAINLCFEDTTFQILQVAFIALLLLARVLKLAAAARYRSTAVVSSVLPHHTVADVKRALATALNDGDNVQSLTLNGYVLKDGHDGEFAAMYGVLVPSQLEAHRGDGLHATARIKYVSDAMAQRRVMLVSVVFYTISFIAVALSATSVVVLATSFDSLVQVPTNSSFSYSNAAPSSSTFIHDGSSATNADRLAVSSGAALTHAVLVFVILSLERWRYKASVHVTLRLWLLARAAFSSIRVLSTVDALLGDDAHYGNHGWADAATPRAYLYLRVSIFVCELALAACAALQRELIPLTFDPTRDARESKRRAELTDALEKLKRSTVVDDEAYDEVALLISELGSSFSSSAAAAERLRAARGGASAGESATADSPLQAKTSSPRHSSATRALGTLCGSTQWCDGSPACRQPRCCTAIVRSCCESVSTGAASSAYSQSSLSRGLQWEAGGSGRGVGFLSSLHVLTLFLSFSLFSLSLFSLSLFRPHILLAQSTSVREEHIFLAEDSDASWGAAGSERDIVDTGASLLERATFSFFSPFIRAGVIAPMRYTQMHTQPQADRSGVILPTLLVNLDATTRRGRYCCLSAPGAKLAWATAKTFWREILAVQLFELLDVATTQVHTCLHPYALTGTAL